MAFGELTSMPLTSCILDVLYWPCGPEQRCASSAHKHPMQTWHIHSHRWQKQLHLTIRSKVNKWQRSSCFSTNCLPFASVPCGVAVTHLLANMPFRHDSLIHICGRSNYSIWSFAVKWTDGSRAVVSIPIASFFFFKCTEGSRCDASVSKHAVQACLIYPITSGRSNYCKNILCTLLNRWHWSMCFSASWWHFGSVQEYCDGRLVSVCKTSEARGI